MLTSAKPKLEKDINKILYNALFKAYMTTFKECPDSDARINNRIKKEIESAAKEFSKTVADEASADLADAIYKFVKEIGIMAMPKMITSPVGPCTGVINMSEFKIS